MVKDEPEPKTTFRNASDSLCLFCLRWTHTHEQGKIGKTCKYWPVWFQDQRQKVGELTKQSLQ